MNIVIPDHGGAKGFNSDISGFAEPLDIVCLAGKSAALYGAGGAARAVLFALQTMGIAHVTILNRTQERARTLLTEFGMAGEALPRSEEHTSELQSLMRISYAVFCLKKNNITYT